MLATADRNGGISIWDPDNAQELFTLAGHKSFVTALSWRGDSKLLASSSEDGTVKLWEMQEGKQFKSWNAHGPGALCVNYGHNGQLVTCGRDSNVTVWDANGGKIRGISTTNDLPLRVTFSHDDSNVFASDFSGHITAYSIKDGNSLGELDANPSPSDKAPAPKRVAEKISSDAKGHSHARALKVCPQMFPFWTLAENVSAGASHFPAAFQHSLLTRLLGPIYALCEFDVCCHPGGIVFD
jgi:WD40 repeat protein